MTPPQPAELLSRKIMYLLPSTEVLFLKTARYLSRHFRLHPKHRADTRAQVARNAANALAGGELGLDSRNLGKPLSAVLQCRPAEPAAGSVRWRLSQRSQSRGTMVDCGGLTAKWRKQPWMKTA